jgi:methionine-S-sulfoxide reductase
MRMTSTPSRTIAALLLSASLAMSACAAEEAVRIPAPALDEPRAAGPLQTAVIAGGCFWGVQGVYQHLKGVRRVVSGYSGGTRATARYERVSDGVTDHAESVEIIYDPAQVTYGEILHVFFSVVHDPTQLDRQGPDVGRQYRSAIFFANESQKKVAQAYIAQLDRAGVYPRRIVTRVDPLRAFYRAEDYHQDYLLNHPRNAYIVINDLPKVENFKRIFPAFYSGAPVRVAGNRTVTPAKPDPRAGGEAGDAPEGDAADDAPAGTIMMRAVDGEKPAAMMSAAPANGAAMSAAPGGAMSSAPGNAMMSAHGATGAAKTTGELPELTATGWLNSKPLTRAALRGKVVVIDFWTYSCINCLRALPHVNAWYRHYKDSGLVVIGVHSPEFAFEKDTGNVRAAIAKFGIEYPVALDNDFAIWKAFNNRFWPAHYFVDAQGKIRSHHFGEGKYERSERTIRTLLVEAGAKSLPDPLEGAGGSGISAAADLSNVKSPETYLGFARAENFTSPGSFVRSETKAYDTPKSLALNQWALGGRWKVGAEKSELTAAPGRIVFRFRARDLHLVLSPPAAGKAVRFRVTLDGKPPGEDHGIDVDANGVGTVREQRLYQLIRQTGAVEEHEFAIEFLDAGVAAYAFTFG